MNHWNYKDFKIYPSAFIRKSPNYLMYKSKARQCKSLLQGEFLATIFTHHSCLQQLELASEAYHG